MESKKYKTILTKDGYLLDKSKFTKKELSRYNLLKSILMKASLLVEWSLKNFHCFI